jgi:2-isopropylmalate synthase
MDTQTANSKNPFFYDVTLRDGNQALKNPWDLQEKETIFKQLLKLGVQGIEVGFAGASDMDFEACEHLARMAPKDVVISSLARAVPQDLERAWEAVQHAAKPRIHTFITTSPYNMEKVLQKTPEQVLQKARESVALCRTMMDAKGKGEVQFSAEHFGDCRDNMDFVIDVFRAVVEEGATVLNLPNTVERYRPALFLDMVSQVVEAFKNKSDVVISVHNHNDLGMATATTVESYFAGAVQLETTLNGLGERAGNTNMYEVACALHNCDVEVPIQFQEIYETALLMENWSGVPIPEKAPLVGSDVVAHRSGIHQDGAMKTKDDKKGAYRAISSDLIGRKESDSLGFTSQSGKTAVLEIIHEAGLPISMEEATYLQPILKKQSEQEGELGQDKILEVYDKYILNTEGPLVFLDVETDSHREHFVFTIEYNGEEQKLEGSGTGPIEACSQALVKLGLEFQLVEYKQSAQDAGSKAFAAHALSEMHVTMHSEHGSKGAIGRARDLDTVKANIKALCNGINRLLNS